MGIKNNVKICDFILENGIKLLKKNKINKLNILVINDVISIELDNDCYIITGMISYKKFIDIISNNYKLVLRYIPKIENKNISESMRYIYKKYNKVNIFIENINKEYKNIV